MAITDRRQEILNRSYELTTREKHNDHEGYANETPMIISNNKKQQI